jgi:hypothetical protein
MTDTSNPAATPTPQALAAICPVCQCTFAVDEALVNCLACHTLYHAECWEDNKGCAIYGCEHVPPTEALNTVEIAASHWGQERKTCPQCHKEIQAAATRCRHCGRVFPSAAPLDADAYRAMVSQEKRLPKVRKTCVILFLLCLLPIVSPAAALISGLVFLILRKDIRKLPVLFGGLLKIGMIIGLLQIIICFLISVLIGTKAAAGSLIE